MCQGARAASICDWAHCAHDSIPSKTRIDARTRAEQIQNQEHAWRELMPHLVDAFLAWKHRGVRESHAARSADEPAGAGTPLPSEGSDWFTVAAICDTGTLLEYPYIILNVVS